MAIETLLSAVKSYVAEAVRGFAKQADVDAVADDARAAAKAAQATADDAKAAVDGITPFSGSYNDLTDTPDLSAYRELSNADFTWADNDKYTLRIGEAKYVAPGFAILYNGETYMNYASTGIYDEQYGGRINLSSQSIFRARSNSNKRIVVDVHQDSESSECSIALYAADGNSMYIGPDELTPADGLLYVGYKNTPTIIRYVETPEEDRDAANKAYVDTGLTSLATRVDALEGAGGGGAFVVNFTTEDGETWTADKTFAEIKSAYDAGMFIRGCVDEDGDKGMAQFASLTDSTAEFRSIKLDNDKSVTYASLTVISGGEVYVHIMSGMLS